jgi:hypothetical protein
LVTRLDLTATSPVAPSSHEALVWASVTSLALVHTVLIRALRIGREAMTCSQSTRLT